MKEQRNRSMEQMRPIIMEWEASGQTKKEYCQQQGISLPVFHYWYKRHKHEETAGGFIPVMVSDKPGNQIEVCYPNGVSLRLSANISPVVLRRYIYL